MDDADVFVGPTLQQRDQPCHAYYAWGLSRALWCTRDGQFRLQPAYDAVETATEAVSTAAETAEKYRTSFSLAGIAVLAVGIDLFAFRGDGIRLIRDIVTGR